MTDDITLAARRRTRALVAAVAAVVLIVVAVVGGLVATVGRRGNPAPAPPSASTATAAQSAPQPGPTTPAALEWVTVAGAHLPAGADGPRDTSAGRARGFAHTPMGAVFAAAHISVRLSPQAGPAVFEPTLREQVVGPEANRLLAALEEEYQELRAQFGVAAGEPVGQLYSTVTGYRIGSALPDVIEVGLLIEGPGQSGPARVALSAQMRWVDGDWALQAPHGGDWNTAVVLVSTTAGYTGFPAGG
ncbi:hypothetical protein ACFPIJ_29710 [Dactylosporangium cerinum]|uniref:DUF8175 domain-containing protein n=1 Tax=Dactylosporangium cerinum TaxID=1434730 RepID=A0ABV9W409_9ACTN